MKFMKLLLESRLPQTELDPPPISFGTSGGLPACRSLGPIPLPSLGQFRKLPRLFELLLGVPRGPRRVGAKGPGALSPPLNPTA